MITIDELMTVNPYTLSEADSLEDARKLMTEKNIRHIPITDDNNHLSGLVSQRDILLATDPMTKKPGSTASKALTLSDIMVKSVHVIHKNTSVRQAALYLQQHKYGCLPVVTDKRVDGIVTDSDFITIAINLLEQVEISEEDVDMEPDDLADLDLPSLDGDF